MNLPITKPYAELFSTVPITDALPDIVIKMGTESNIDYSEYLVLAEQFKSYFSNGLKYEDPDYEEFIKIKSPIATAVGKIGHGSITTDTFLTLLLSPCKPTAENKSGPVIYNILLPEDGFVVLIDSLSKLPPYSSRISSKRI